MGQDNKWYLKIFSSAFLFGVALIIFNKIFENWGGILRSVGNFLSLLSPFFVGFFLAFFLYPAVRKLEETLSKSNKRFFVKRRRSLAVVSVYAVLLLAVLILGFALLPRLSASLSELFSKIPDYLERAMLFWEKQRNEDGLLGRMSLSAPWENIDLQGFFSRDIWHYFDSIRGVVNVFVNWLLGFVIGAYVLLERGSLLRILKMLIRFFVKEKTVQRLGGYARRICDVFYRFFYGQLTDSAIIGLVAILGFSFLKVPYGILVGILVGLFNIIPYFGPFLGAAPAVLVTLFAKGFYPALWTALFLLVLQQFDGLWLSPKILGGSVGISPFWVIFAIVIFGGLFGLWGMVFGVPLVASLRLIIEDFLDDGKMNLSQE